MRYPAVMTREGRYTLATFPDCPGCQTFAKRGESILELATEALDGWLEASLEDGDAPARPSRRLAGEKVLWVPVSAALAVALELRWARLDAGLSQAELGRRIGVTQQAVAKLERAQGNPRIQTIEKIAHALGVRADVHLVPV